MKKILLICNEGMSTGFLCNKMNEYAQQQGLDIHAWAVPESALEGQYQEADIVLLGPQIGYLMESIRKRVHNTLPVDAISPIDFGRINAKSVVEQALSLINKN
ncbi:PTS sugar transporter subunit IIB [Superficieibacter electus]|uniref:PTS sugar transporter subunit IIB n=1 Tax=Superficieibacter electus TaxID=2022662 RepID=A0A2P5GW55_9ENTR|nr:PTS sugar transporter subunit IIB [Superficieibacter electus]POP47777.1 PTS sugar transporter subunit IIB [Superficieibacter electus]POP50790.1 PTS sugar transporter subunit IIB [Superficieibacter electus]